LEKFDHYFSQLPIKKIDNLTYHRSQLIHVDVGVDDDDDGGDGHHDAGSTFSNVF
jgi:hypothetical protein